MRGRTRAYHLILNYELGVLTTFLKKERKNELGQAIKFIRTHKGMEQKELAKKIGMDPSNYSRLERGNNFTVKTLNKILTALDCQLKIEL